jgi:hypothetical protein
VKTEEGALPIAQQQKAKMPAAGATQALRLFCETLGEVLWHRKIRSARETG